MLEPLIVVAALLCGVVGGLLFGFAVVAMPGLRTLDDATFIRSFQVMDRVIQDNQPVFMLAWLGSVVALIASVVVGLGQLDGFELGLLLAAAVVYLLGVQLPTATINIPLNNQLQSVDVESAGATQLAAERTAFETRWNRWNAIRTAFAVFSVLLLLVVLTQV